LKKRVPSSRRGGEGKAHHRKTKVGTSPEEERKRAYLIMRARFDREKKIINTRRKGPKFGD